LEISVYDRLARRIAWIVLPALFLPPVILFATLSRSLGGGLPGDLGLVLAAVIAVTALTNLLVLLVVSVRVRLDPDEGKVLRIYPLFGWTLYQKEFALAQFDRVSLFRSARGGYVARLVGRENDILLCVSSNLKQARETAEDAARCCRLSLNDQL